MRKTLGHPVADDFLGDVERESRRLPRRRRAELIGDLEAHLREAVDWAEGDEARLRTLVDALGSPAEIVAAAGPPESRRLAGRDLAAILLLLLGGFVAGVGWLAGVVLLWASAAWSTRQKVLGTVVFPGGLVLPLWLWIGVNTLGSACTKVDEQAGGCSRGRSSSLTVGLLALALVASVVGPVATAIYLARTARPST